MKASEEDLAWAESEKLRIPVGAKVNGYDAYNEPIQGVVTEHDIRTGVNARSSGKTAALYVRIRENGRHRWHVCLSDEVSVIEKEPVKPTLKAILPDDEYTQSSRKYKTLAQKNAFLKTARIPSPGARVFHNEHAVRVFNGHMDGEVLGVDYNMEQEDPVIVKVQDSITKEQLYVNLAWLDIVTEPEENTYMH
jgi:hypothetical protein